MERIRSAPAQVAGWLIAGRVANMDTTVVAVMFFSI